MNLFQAGGERWWTAVAMEALGGLDFGRNSERLPAYHLESLAIRRELGDLLGTAQELRVLADHAAFNMVEFAEAEQLYGEASAIFRQLGDPTSVRLSLECDDYRHVINGRFAEALELRRRQLAIAEDVGDRYARALASWGLCETLTMLGRYEEGAACGRAALDILHGVGTSWSSVISMRLAGLPLLAQRGDVLRAVEVWAVVSRYPFVGNSQFFADLYGRPVEAAAADLPPAAVEAARQRGRRLNPWEIISRYPLLIGT